MADKKWKYQAKKTNQLNFLRFEDAIVKKIKVSDWSFDKGQSGYLFKCYVIEEEGIEVDKMWFVYDYEFVQTLKKALGVKCVCEKKEIFVLMNKKSEDGADITFELKKEEDYLNNPKKEEEESTEDEAGSTEESEEKSEEKSEDESSKE